MLPNITNTKRHIILICSLLLMVFLICTSLVPAYADTTEGDTDPDTLEWLPVYFPQDEFDRPAHGEYYINITMAFYRYMEESRAYYDEHPEETEDWPEEEYEDRIKYRAMMHLESIRHSLEDDVYAEYYVCPESPDPLYKVKKVTISPEGDEINYFPRDAVGDIDDESQYVMESHDYIDDPIWTWEDEETAYADFICFFGADLDINKESDETHDFSRVYAQVSQEVITPATELSDGELKCTATVVFPDSLTFLDITYTDTKTFTIPATGNPERVMITVQPESKDVEWPEGGVFHIEVDKPDLVASYQWILKDRQGTSYVLKGTTATTDTLVLPAADTFIPFYDLYCIVTDINGNKTVSETARLTITNNGERKMVLYVCDQALEPGESLDLYEAGLGSGTVAFDSNGTEATLTDAVINTSGIQFDTTMSPSLGILVEGTAEGYDTFYLHIEGDCIINDEFHEESGNGIPFNAHLRASERPDDFPLLVLDGEGSLTLNGGGTSLYVDSDLELDVDLTTHPREKDNCTGIAARNIHICPGANIDISSVGDGIVAQNILYVQEASLHIDTMNHLSQTADSEVEGILVGGKLMCDNAVIDIDMHADPERILPEGRVITYMYGISSKSNIELYGTKLSIDMLAEEAEIPYANNFCGITGDYFEGLELDDASQIEIKIISDEINRAAGITTNSNDYGDGITLNNGSMIDIDIQAAGDIIGIDMPNRVYITDSTMKVNASSADGGNVYAMHAPSTDIELNDAGNMVSLKAENGVAIFMNDERTEQTEYDPEYEPILLKLYGKAKITVPENGLVSSYGYPMFGVVFPGETIYDPLKTDMPASEVIISADDVKPIYTLYDAELKYQSKKYNGAGRTQTGTTVVKGLVTYSDDSEGEVVTLTKGTDYNIIYKNNINVGTATMTIKGLGNYKGQTLTRTFKIMPVTIKNVKLSYESKSYKGKALKPGTTVTATVNGETVTLVRGTDYSVSHKNNKNAGTATVIIKGKGNFTGTIEKTFKITPEAIKSVKLSPKSMTYTGKALKPETNVTATVNGEKVTLVRGTDYSVAHKNNKNVGTAIVTITGKGNYKGTLTATFAIIAKK